MSGSERDRRLAATVAGHRADPDTARRLLADPDPTVREAALGALQRLLALDAAALDRLLTDPDPRVRIRAVEASIDATEVDVTPLLADDVPRVVEAAAFVLGERSHDPSPIALLAGVAAEHADELCRESAVAALGALGGHPAADHRQVIETLLGAMADRPAIRRRAVIGLHQFDDPDAVEAVRAALRDRDRQVRAVAGELLGEAVD